MSIHEARTYELLHLMRKQYPATATTYSKCPTCESVSRGGDWCADCLQAELIRRGAKPESVKLFRETCMQKAIIERTLFDRQDAVSKETGD